MLERWKEGFFMEGVRATPQPLGQDLEFETDHDHSAIVPLRRSGAGRRIRDL